MLRLLRLLLVLFSRFFRSRRDLVLENLALRQQLSVLERRHPRPRIAAADKLFWVMLRRLWAGWKSASIFVQPETVVYRCPLASGGLQAILDVALAASGSYGEKKRKQGIKRNDFPHGLGTEHGVRHAYAQGDLLGNRGYVRICRQYIQNPHSGQEAHLGALCSWVSLNFPPQKQP